MGFCIISPRTCQSTLVIAGRLHNVKMISTGSIRGKNEESSVGRPTWVLAIGGFRRQLSWLPSFSGNRNNDKTACHASRISDSISSRRPVRGGIVTAAVRQSSGFPAGDIENVELRRTASIGYKNQLAAIGRPRRRNFNPGLVREPANNVAASIQQMEVAVAAHL